MTVLKDFPALLQAFFIDRLISQRNASPHTIVGYRDSFRLLLRFAEERLGRQPSALAIEDLDTPFIAEFLNHLEEQHGNTARTRNARLAAIHSFFKYVALSEPAYADLCRRVLAIPAKRYERKLIEFLTPSEVDAILNAPDTTTWIGRRDRALLLLAVQTGLRVSELIGLHLEDIVLGTMAHVRCQGKGRKERCTPLRGEAIPVMKAWLRASPNTPLAPLFPSTRGGHLSRDAVEHLVAKHCRAAQRCCPSLRRKNVTPHVLRHTLAMDLLQHGIDRSVIALWLGHESPETTQMYLHADLSLKQKALDRTTPTDVKPGRYRPDDELLAFLESL